MGLVAWEGLFIYCTYVLCKCVYKMVCKLWLFVGPPGSPDGMMHASKGPPLPPPPPISPWIHDVSLLISYPLIL